MWSEKYRPATLEEMIGDPRERDKLLIWLKRWKRGAKSALLVGPPGTGKTTTVHLAAERLGIQLVELNASDARTREKLSKVIGELIGSLSLSGARTLIFLDEVDGLAGRADYGAIEYIKDAVRKSENPIVMAANDPESDEVRKLASVTTKIEFGRTAKEAIVKHLQAIAQEEGCPSTGEELATIAEAANGDVRVAINFLQSGGAAGKDVELTARESVEAFFSALDSKSAQRALRAYPGSPRDKVRDLFTSVVRASIHEERRSAALDVLSRADIIMGRIMRGKDWRLLRYLDELLAAELWMALGDGGARYSQDAVPWMMQLRIWNDSKKLRDIGLLAGKKLWISQKGALVEDLPYILLLVGHARFREEFVGALGLEQNYSEFLVKESARAASRQP